METYKKIIKMQKIYDQVEYDASTDQNYRKSIGRFREPGTFNRHTFFLYEEAIPGYSVAIRRYDVCEPKEKRVYVFRHTPNIEVWEESDALVLGEIQSSRIFPLLNEILTERR